MWLLDVNMPREIVGLLDELGVHAQHTGTIPGWDELTNGALVEAAWSKNFDCVLTRDRLFAESAARALKKFPEFSVILVTLPQARGSEFLKVFRSAWERTRVIPIPGRSLSWPG